MHPHHDPVFLEIILNSVADGVFTVDREWRITSFNRAAEKITGVSASQAIGTLCRDIFHADICERGCALKKTMETGCELVEVSARILDSQGRSIPISLSTAVLLDSDGSLIGAVETFRDLSALEQLRREINHQYSYQDIVGKSEAFQKIFSLLPDIAESDATVLIEGPSGSGKELLARAVHNLSKRRKKPYVVVNCGTLPPNLFESELFGYSKGAFTDAKSNKLGRIALADEGTIFFDEISELPLQTQVKLLRLLQEHEYEPLGSLKTQKTNVRVVAATNRKLAECVSRGSFRDDLYFRLAVVRLPIPPLAKRRADIPYLVDHFIARFNNKRGKHIAGLTPSVMKLLMQHDFPGNVRELENIIEYGFVLCHEPFIDVHHLPEELQEKWNHWNQSRLSQHSSIQCAESQVIEAALHRNNGQMSSTAKELGMSRTTLWRKIKKYSIKTTL